MKNLLCLSTLISACLLGAQELPTKRPHITGIAHIGLTTHDVEADRRFYMKTLGWTAAPSVESPGGMRFFGDPSQTVEVTRASTPSEPAFNHIAFATSDAAQMRSYLIAKGIEVPDHVVTWSNGTKSLRVKDPEGNVIEFVQPTRSKSEAAQNPRAISSRVIHAGFIVRSAAAESRFYKDILGFRPYWTGGMKDGVVDFVSLQVPDGTDWLEYMLNVGPHPSRQQLGVYDHFSLGVVNIDDVVTKLSSRGWKPSTESMKQMGRDGKYQLNIYDPDQVRVEYMEFRPAEKPCCSPFTGPHPQP